MKYLGYYSIGAGQTYNREGYEYTNLREAKRSMRKIAVGNCTRGASGIWYVTDITGNTIAEGKVQR